MIKLNKLEKNLTKNISNKNIKSVNDFCNLFYNTEILGRPFKKEYKEFTNIIIYNNRDYAYKTAKTFRFLIQTYVNDNYIKLKKDLSLHKLKPFWDYDTQVYYENMIIFHELNDSCENYSQQKFSINKPIRLKILALFGRLPEKSDFNITILKKIKLHIEKNHKFYQAFLALIMILLMVLFWIFDFASFKTWIKSKF
ncbi:MAG: hypothetical protein GF353_00570 [Candidatus Lokiarchaeota archaeon]|nr:hypothetical protein [Candidatus Lokiarchaeota archaeon]